MKRFLLTAVIFLSVSLCVSAEGSAGNSEFVIPGVIGGGILVATIASIFKERLVPWIRRLFKGWKDAKDFSKVDAAVENLLRNVGIPDPFADWLGDVAAHVITSLVSNAEEFTIRLYDEAKASYSSQDPSSASKILPIPRPLLYEETNRYRAMDKALHSREVKPLVKSLNDVVKKGSDEGLDRERLGGILAASSRHGIGKVSDEILRR